MAGLAQQALHLARPIFLLDVEQRLQFAQVVCVAQCMQHTGQLVVRLPVVVDDNAADTGHQAAALWRDAIEGQQDS